MLHLLISEQGSCISDCADAQCDLDLHYYMGRIFPMVWFLVAPLICTGIFLQFKLLRSDGSNSITAGDHYSVLGYGSFQTVQITPIPTPIPIFY